MIGMLFQVFCLDEAHSAINKASQWKGFVTWIQSKDPVFAQDMLSHKGIRV